AWRSRTGRTSVRSNAIDSRSGRTTLGSAFRLTYLLSLGIGRAHVAGLNAGAAPRDARRRRVDVVRQVADFRRAHAAAGRIEHVGAIRPIVYIDFARIDAIAVGVVTPRRSFDVHHARCLLDIDYA